MEYRQLQYTLVPIDADWWEWRFRIEEQAFKGKTRARLKLLAERKVRMKIDRALKTRRLKTRLAAE